VVDAVMGGAAGAAAEVAGVVLVAAVGTDSYVVLLARDVELVCCCCSGFCVGSEEDARPSAKRLRELNFPCGVDEVRGFAHRDSSKVMVGIACWLWLQSSEVVIFQVAMAAHVG